MIVNIKENSLLSSLSSFNTVSTLWLVICHRVVPIGTSHLWLLRVQTHQSSASVLLSLLFGRKTVYSIYIPWRETVSWLFFPHIFPVKPWPRRCSLCSDREPLSWLRFLRWAISAVGFLSTRPWGRGGQYYFSRLVHTIHHPEGSVSAFSDASVFRILSSVHGVGKVFQFLALCLGLSTAPQVFTRVMAPVWSFLHSLGFGFGLICMTDSFRRPPGNSFLSLRTFLGLRNSLGMVVDWEMSQLVAHQ